jgi:NAD-dependent SIR2 family protein deacetylase
VWLSALRIHCLRQELWPAVDKHAPTATHHFLRLLHDKGLLATVFSQNIDGLEQIAGLPADKVVNAHGSFDGESSQLIGICICLMRQQCVL